VNSGISQRYSEDIIAYHENFCVSKLLLHFTEGHRRLFGNENIFLVFAVNIAVLNIFLIFICKVSERDP
jgi:hypothetical protein